MVDLGYSHIHTKKMKKPIREIPGLFLELNLLEDPIMHLAKCGMWIVRDTTCCELARLRVRYR